MLKPLFLLANIYLATQQRDLSSPTNRERILEEQQKTNTESQSEGMKVTPEQRKTQGVNGMIPSFEIPNMKLQQQECHKEMMVSYGLEGEITPKISNHKYCPMVTQNCCTPEDEETSMHIWNNQVKFVVERYYETYLYSIKYILGFSQELFLLARDFEKSNDIKCKNAAIDYISMNFNARITEEVYKIFSKSVHQMIDLRKGFYCILCDARAQEKLKDFWATTNLAYREKVYLSKEFCRKLVDTTIKASYFTVYYLKRFADNLGTLMNCKTNSSASLKYEIPSWISHMVKNCYFFKNKYFFFFCERYCEEYHLTKPTPIFDGNLIELRKFVEYVMANRRQAFYYPNNNMLMDGVNFEEEYIKFYYQEVFKDAVFYRPLTQQVMLDQFKTDVIYYGGMDPWESCEKSLYTLVIAGSFALKVLSVLITMLVYAE